ncbi:MAG: DeoR/GlpR transcriptional regulator [Clostridia bacterium]|nr:DeoR/GlpR transcriptional regulator [Clostridia bacterium]MBQ8332937.1 DeoR/GlpR transcriptional regulator [Clostridia bacterium]MBQ8370149.1 DeoR/GlpR transcriptional regulator [Clostridia bacterium]MBQ8511763.1 DeoR/GlpR transcriptional regulator [Clostridia bacterium]
METGMLKEERREAILAYIEENGKITTAVIQRKFNVGYGTAMTDLDDLAKQGLVKRIHGGAIKIKQVGFNPHIGSISAKDRCAEVKENYLAIAKAAVDMIEPEDVVYITSASMGYLIARELPADRRCTIVTSSITIAEELRQKPAIRVIVTGGEMQQNGNFYDEFTADVIRRMRFDKCFVTAAACSAKFGLSIQGGRNIGIKNLVLDNSRMKIALIPMEKMGQESIMQICPVTKLDMIITETDASEDECASIEEAGVQIVAVPSPTKNEEPAAE